MEIIILKIENMPDKEVIAFDYKGECLVGYIHYDGFDEFVCENNHEVLNKVTHFMFIPIKGKDY